MQQKHAVFYLLLRGTASGFAGEEIVHPRKKFETNSEPMCWIVSQLKYPPSHRDERYSIVCRGMFLWVKGELCIFVASVQLCHQLQKSSLNDAVTPSMKVDFMDANPGVLLFSSARGIFLKVQL